MTTTSNSPPLDDGGNHMPALLRLQERLMAALDELTKKKNDDANSEILACLTELQPIADDLDHRRKMELQQHNQAGTSLSASDGPWRALAQSGVLVTVVQKVYCGLAQNNENNDTTMDNTTTEHSTAVLAIRSRAAPFMSSWSRALSHNRATQAGAALLPHLPQWTQVMQSDLKLQRTGDNQASDIETLQRHAEIALHMMTTSKQDAIRTIERQGTVDALSNYMAASSPWTLSASIALGQLVARDDGNGNDPTRMQRIVAQSGVIDQILHAMQQLLQGSTDMGMYTLQGLLIATSCLAVNDANKRLLVKAGYIERCLVPVLHNQHRAASYNPSRCYCLAAEAVWNLAFLPDLHGALKRPEHGIVARLQQLKQESSVEKEVYYAQGALFELGEKEEHLQELQHQKEQQSTHDATNNDPQQPMIMLSYNWGAQETVVQIRQRLHDAGFDNVWLDLEQMSGSTLAAMARAVEESAVIMTCISRQYQDSAACRTEAEYAYVLQKQVVPLMLEAEQPWRASGWLGAQLGAKLWYDFSQPDQFEVSMQNLVGALQKMLLPGSPEERSDKNNNGSTPTPAMTTTTLDPSAAPTGSGTTQQQQQAAATQPSQPSHSALVATPPLPILQSSPPSHVIEMDVNSVQEWMQTVGLPKTLRQAFARKRVTGRSLVELHRLLVASSQQGGDASFYYKMLAHCCGNADGALSEQTGLLLEFSVHLQELIVLKDGTPS